MWLLVDYFLLLLGVMADRSQCFGLTNSQKGENDIARTCASCRKELSADWKEADEPKYNGFDITGRCPKCRQELISCLDYPKLKEVVTPDDKGQPVIDWLKFVKLYEGTQLHLCSLLGYMGVLCFEGGRDEYYDIVLGGHTGCLTSPVGVFYFTREPDAVAYMEAEHGGVMYADRAVRRVHLIEIHPPAK